MKSFLKQFIPPVFFNALRRFKRSQAHFSGVYANWHDVKNEDLWGKEATYWQTLSKEKLIKATQDDGNFAPPVTYRSLVTLLANQVADTGSCCVLDWGGGTGIIYHDIKRSLMRPERISWCVADGADITALGKQYVGSRDRLTFYGLDEVDRFPKPDIVYINTTMQYVEDFKVALTPLIRLMPAYFCFTRLMACDVPTLITEQTIGGRRAPCIFLNKKEFTDFFHENGYNLVFISREDDFSDHYNANIPMNLRIPYELNVVFRRN